MKVNFELVSIHRDFPGFTYRPETDTPIQLSYQSLFLFLGPCQRRVKDMTTFIIGLFIRSTPVLRNSFIVKGVLLRGDSVLIRPRDITGSLAVTLFAIASVIKITGISMPQLDRF